MRRLAGALLLFLLVSCVKTPPAVVRAPVPDDLSVLRLAGEWSIPPLGRFPPVIGLRFGGISGLAALEGGTELLGISDDRDGSRMYRFGVSGEGASFRVVPTDSIPLQWAPSGPPAADSEAIAILRSGNVLVASEGIGSLEPRVPPALIEYGQQGQFVRQLEVRDRFSPNPTGPPSRGVRANMGFESLTIAPGGRRLYTATETALVQDGEPASFDTGAQ
ncbi:MAG TPA: esterase-like activity of phytase family protein, partial [Vicinamibacterales bacterium]|nr:esterase-like activity of phytase family protein [Vicinamibacterales bacterium]